MKISDAKFATEDAHSISVVIDGREMTVPVDPANRHYRDIVTLGLVIAPFEPQQE